MSRTFSLINFTKLLSFVDLFYKVNNEHHLLYSYYPNGGGSPFTPNGGGSPIPPLILDPNFLVITCVAFNLLAKFLIVLFILLFF